MNRIEKYSGIGLLELMLALAIIALLLIAATRYYLIARAAEQVEEGGNIVTAVYSAGQNWLENKDTLTGVTITDFVANASVPSDFGKTNATPWGGSIGVTGNANVLTLTFDKIPATVCQNIKPKILNKFANSTLTQDCPTSGTGSLGIAFTMGS